MRPVGVKTHCALPRWIAACLLPAALLAAAPFPASAWGTPHPEITRHALRMLPPSDRADARLGGLRQMEDLAWGGDYQGEVHARYAVDDFLLFPGFPRHSSHVMPAVAETWVPYFRRALQALRGESPPNAARWLGSFLHFVEDSGSPPHALPTPGELHTRMENYIYTFDARITGYTPRLLGAQHPEAEAGLTRRMQELVAFSRSRAERLLPLARRADRAACEPLVLECAQETMRVVADVTHTLLRLSEAGPAPGTASLAVSVRAPALAEQPLGPAKLLLEGTGFSTTTDAAPALPGAAEYRGEAVLGDLPPGTFTLCVLRAGTRTERRRVRLAPGRTARLALRLRPDAAPGNLVRNADLRLRWISAERPDHWTRTPPGWRSDVFPALPGRRYVAGARSGEGPRPVRVLESDDPRMPATVQPRALEPDGEFTPSARYVALLVPGETRPDAAWVRPGFAQGAPGSPTPP